MIFNILVLSCFLLSEGGSGTPDTVLETHGQAHDASPATGGRAVLALLWRSYPLVGSLNECKFVSEMILP